MPMIAFAPNTRIRSADVNANFANALALDTPRTVIVTHTWNALQVFGQGIQVTGASTFGQVTVSGSFSVTGGIAATATISGARFRATAGSASGRVAFGADDDNGMFFISGNAPTFARGGEPKFQIQQNAIVALGTAVFTGNGSGLTNLPAASLTGNISPDRLTSVPAGSLTGTIALNRIPGLPASKVTSGEMDVARLPLIQHTENREAISVPGDSFRSFAVTINGVNAEGTGFASIEEGTATPLIVTIARCFTDGALVLYANPSPSEVSVSAHTLRIVIYRFQ